MAKTNGIDLSKLSLPELETLAQDVQAEITNRREAEKQRVLEQMRELAASIGMTPEELLRAQRAQLGGGRAGMPGVAVKYRHPENPSLTWSGRGKRPQWLTDALAEGKSLEDLAAE
jgi:DNA-binding protein H-NS